MAFSMNDWCALMDDACSKIHELAVSARVLLLEISARNGFCISNFFFNGDKTN